MKNQRKAMLYGLATVLMWSTVASAFKLSLGRLHVAQLLLYSSAASACVLAVVLARRGGLGLLFGYGRRQYLLSLLYGMLNPFLYYLLLFRAYDLLPAQEAQPINYTWAITLTLLSVPFLKQKLRLWDAAAVAVGYAGVVIIATRGDVAGLRFSNAEGVGLALLSTLVWAVYWILNTRDDRDPIAGLLLNFLFGLPPIIVVCALTSGFAVPLAGLLGAVYVGVFEMGLAFVCWLTAMRLAENTARIANLIFLSPFLSLVLIHVLVGEEIYPSTYVGLTLIMAGLGLQQLRRA